MSNQYPYWLQHCPVGQVYSFVSPQDPSGETVLLVNACRALLDLSSYRGVARSIVAKEKITRQ